MAGVNRGVRVLDECLCIPAVVWINADTDTRRNVKIVLFNGTSFCHNMQQPSRHGGSVFRLMSF
jgi:hypothetical protein